MQDISSRVPLIHRVAPNKHMQRAGTYKVLGRGRSSLVPGSVLRARVLTGQPAGADVGR